MVSDVLTKQINIRCKGPDNKVFYQTVNAEIYGPLAIIKIEDYRKLDHLEDNIAWKYNLTHIASGLFLAQSQDKQVLLDLITSLTAKYAIDNPLWNKLNDTFQGKPLMEMHKFITQTVKAVKK